MSDRRPVLLLGATGLGRGDEEVTLLAADSPVVDLFRQLEGLGVKVLACKTCIDTFGLQEKLEAGEVSTMPVIADILLQGDVLTI